jgi:multidrug resistance efflux pump
MKDINKIKKAEEVDHIINRMPKKFGIQITVIVMLSILLLLLFGFLISYPDVQTGTVSINTKNPAIKIISPNSGKIILVKKNQQHVYKDEIIAYIDNPAQMNDVLQIKALIEKINVSNSNLLMDLKPLPNRIYLGIINNKYYTFLDALQQFKNYHQNGTFDHQLNTYRELLHEQNNILTTTKQKAELSNRSINYMNKFAERDSILLQKKVISAAEFERNKISYLNAAYSVVNNKNEASQIMLELFRTQNAITETQIKKEEIEKSLLLNLNSSYHEFSMALKSFEESYIFKSPQTGTLQYLNFWNDNIYVKAGEPIFSIVPTNNKIIAQIFLPNSGAGKVTHNQNVVIKLDNYPYNEYGSIKGIVNDISLVTNTQETAQGSIESYLVQVELPDGLKTNYGKTLNFKYELKGIAEIITKDRRLIERIFDNLKYMLTDKNQNSQRDVN